MEYIILGVLLIVLFLIFRSFRPAATQKINDDLFVIRCGFVNFYAVTHNDGVMLFDTGTNPNLAVSGLIKCGLDPDSVTHVFLTHTDYDHAGGISAFRNAKLYISNDEVQMINGDKARRGLIYNRRIENYHTLGNGDITYAGGVSVQVFVKPGHTPGSAVYIIGDRYLATGDLLRIYKNGKIKPFLILMNMNHKQNIQSVAESSDILNNAGYILTAHTGYYKNRRI